ncbi:hypothetical protein [Sphingobium vermicomposti]|uniref:Uncharacterized protein n=1 Tax=Sphingobium vermicomposti TaxID=529005 RepID=A0A846M124_9SPHN|nr:hypothetical protein [Sphingobium vermicomposti]NIJ15622.1 hypothetical protein [Sphingobium vermicomposti]
MTAAPWAITTDDHWSAIVAVCEQRDAAWTEEIRKAGNGDKRWRLTEARNADMAQWHIMAVLIAHKLDIPTLIREDLTGVGRPPFPTDREGWLAIVATARRALDKAADRDHLPLYRNLYTVWRWAHLYVHVWALPGLDLRATVTEQRNAA